METFDTNVVLRLVYRDDATQAAQAERAWRDAVASGGVFLTGIVLVELSWVLRVAAKWPRASIAGAIANLCDSAGVIVEQEACVRRALALYEAGPADFSDYMIVEVARSSSALPVVTFGEGLGRVAGARLLSSR